MKTKEKLMASMYSFARSFSTKTALILSVFAFFISRIFFDTKVALGIALLAFAFVAMCIFLFLSILFSSDQRVGKKLSKSIKEKIEFFTILNFEYKDKVQTGFLYLTEKMIYIIPRRTKEHLLISITKEELTVHFNVENDTVFFSFDDGTEMKLLPTEYEELITYLNKFSYKTDN